MDFEERKIAKPLIRPRLVPTRPLMGRDRRTGRMTALLPDARFDELAMLEY